jgi:hypothetical protein
MTLAFSASVKALQLLAVLATALLLGTTFAPVLEMPAQLAMSGNLWATVQRAVVYPFSAVGGPLEIVAIIINLGVLAAALSRPQLLFFTAGSALSLLLAFAVWVIFTQPASLQVMSWGDGPLPADWGQWRAQWEFSQLVRFLLHLSGLLLLASSLLNLPLEEQPRSSVVHRSHG